jgi:Family of unknown function (DUF6152)
MKSLVARTISGVVSVLAVSAAVAHHSAAMFDMEKEITVSGTVKDFQYTNPHSWLIVVVPGADGKEIVWSFEAEGPSTLERAGIKRSSLQAGDKVTVKTHPMKDGRTAGTWLTLTKSDGTVLQPRGAIPPPKATSTN